MVRRDKPKQLSPAELERFLKAAEGLHNSIVQPLISPQCDRHRSLQALHQALLKSVVEITGKGCAVHRWNGTGPVR